jgi:nickel-dependent lactate racemase
MPDETGGVASASHLLAAHRRKAHVHLALRWRAWHGDELLELNFPPPFKVAVYPPKDGPDIGAEGIRERFANPIGGPRIAELSRGKKSAVIVVDDIARPTPASRVIPPILDELRAGGIPDARIRFLTAVGCHRAMTRSEMARKLGEDVVSRFQVLNHTPYERLVRVGETSRGTPVDINGCFAEAELRIGVGQISPHGGPGWSGGAKIVIPGVAGIETITANHKPGWLRLGLVTIEGNEWRADMEEAAQLAGLDAIVNVVVNSERGIAGVFVGDLVAAHRRGVERAWEVMSTSLPPEPVDSGIINQYPKDTTFMHLDHALHVLNSARRPIVQSGGTLVILSASSDGFGFHALEAPGMRHGPTGPRPVFEPFRVVVMCPNINQAEMPPSLPDSARLVPDWAGVLAALGEYHPRGGAVAVFPCGAIEVAA